MKKKKLICALTICLSLNPITSVNANQSSNKPIVIQNTIIIESKPAELNSLSPKSQKWMRALAERSWSAQNETSEKTIFSAEYFNNGVKKYYSGDYKGAISDFSQAINTLNTEHIKILASTNYAKSDSCYYYRGYSKLKLKDYLGAIQDFSVIISEQKNDKANAEVYYDRGLARYYLKDNSGAIEDYETALSINPNLEITKKTLGDRFINYKNQISSAENSHEPRFTQDVKIATDGIAEPSLNSYIIDEYYAPVRYDQDPNFVNASNKTDKKMEIENYAKAVEEYKYTNKGSYSTENRIMHCNNAIKLYDNFAEAYYTRGNEYFLIGDNKKALQDYNKAVELKPNLAAVYNNKGILKYMQKDYLGALEDLRTSQKLSPQSSNTYILIGNINREMGNYAEALNNYNYYKRYITGNTETKIGNASGYSVILNEIGINHLKTNNNKEAVKSFKKALNFEITADYSNLEVPFNMYAYNNLAIAEMLSKNAKSALKNAERAKILSISYNDMDCYQKIVYISNLAKNQLTAEEIKKIDKETMQFSKDVKYQKMFKENPAFNQGFSRYWSQNYKQFESGIKDKENECKHSI